MIQDNQFIPKGDVCGDIEENIAYYDPSLNDGLADKVDTAEECRGICQQYEQCVAWTWLKHSDPFHQHSCWTKSMTEKRQVVPGSVSGLRMCKG